MRLFAQPKNQGKGAALRLGIERDRRRSSSFRTPTSNTTRQDYPRLVSPIAERKADVVFGSRFSGANTASCTSGTASGIGC